MGRNKIKIERITNERTRLATFNKRKNGLVKKAMELAILCGCEVALIVIGNNKLTQYSSSDMDQLLLRYTEGGFEEPQAEPLTSDDYPKLFGKKGKGKEEPPAKKPRLVESPIPPQTLNQTVSVPVAAAAANVVKPLAVAPHPQLATDGRNSPTAAAVPTPVARGPSPPLGVGGAARLTAPQQQLAPAYFGASYAGYPSAARVVAAPSQSQSVSRVPSLCSVPTTASPTTGRVSPSHRGSFAGSGSVSPTFEGSKSPVSSNPPTPPGSGGHYAAEEMRRVGGRLLQEQQFALKVNKKKLSLAIPDSSASSGNFPGSSSAGHSRHTTYTPGFTGLSVPSGGVMPFDPSELQHSASVLPSPFFASSETPGEHGHYLPSWGWLTSSPRHNGDSLPQERFLSRDLNIALQDGTLHHQLGLAKPIYANEGAKRKASELRKA